MQKTSYLEAVNTCLRVVGDQPVSSTTGALPAVAAAAIATLDETSREVQQRVWHFNSEYDVELLPNQEGKIALPLNVVRVDVADTDVTQRGDFLFNRETNSYVFTSSVDAYLVRILDWDELPEAARNYIMIRAARKTQDRYNQGSGRYIYSEADEAQALLDLKDADGDSADYNLLYDNYAAFKIINRGRPDLN